MLPNDCPLRNVIIIKAIQKYLFLKKCK